AAFDHLECDTSSPAGCQRCAPKTPTICCDLCKPDAFTHLKTTTSISASKTMRKSHIKPYNTGSQEISLRSALLTWHDEKARLKFPSAVFTNFGGNLVMTTSVIQRVVDCAQSSKLASKEDLCRELAWR
ncbi:hypothetical protein JAAARDRAFT_107435, partial [Jaapia argillacea MUCL 33604]